MPDTLGLSVPEPDITALTIIEFADRADAIAETVRDASWQFQVASEDGVAPTAALGKLRDAAIEILNLIAAVGVRSTL